MSSERGIAMEKEVKMKSRVEALEAREQATMA